MTLRGGALAAERGRPAIADPVERRAGQRQPGPAASVGTAGRPPGRGGRARTAAARRPSGSARRGGGSRRRAARPARRRAGPQRLVGELQPLLLAGPAERPGRTHTGPPAPAPLGDPAHLRVTNVSALTVGSSLGGTRNPDSRRRRRGRPGPPPPPTRRATPASTTAGAAAGRAPASSRARRRARPAPRRRRRVGLGAGAAASCQPPPRPRARTGRARPERDPCAAGGDRASHQPGHPAHRRANTGRPGAPAAAAARAAPAGIAAPGRGHSCGHHGREATGRSARPAYTPPSSGSTSRSTTSSPKRSPTSAPTATSRSAPARGASRLGGGAGETVVGEQAGQRPGSTGTPSSVRPASGAAGPRPAAAAGVVGWTNAVPEAELARSAPRASGRPASTDSAPRVHRDPGHRRCQLAAPARPAALDDDPVPARREPRARGQPGDPAADDERRGSPRWRRPGPPAPADRGPPGTLGLTSSTTRVSTSGSVSGSTPWPRLKTWPGAAAPERTTSRTRSRDHRPRRAQQRRVQVALHARRGPSRRLARPAGSASRRPTHVGAGLHPSPEQLAGADPEVDPRHAQRGHPAQHPRRVRLHVARGSRPRRGAGPGVEELDGAGSGGHLHPQEGAGDVGQPAAERVPQRRVAVPSSPWSARSPCTARPRPGSWPG